MLVKVTAKAPTMENRATTYSGRHVVLLSRGWECSLVSRSCLAAVQRVLLDFPFSRLLRLSPWIGYCLGPCVRLHYVMKDGYVMSRAFALAVVPQLPSGLAIYVHG